MSRPRLPFAQPHGLLSLPWQTFCAQELESCQQHGETLRCGAASLLAAVPQPEPLPLGDGQERLPQLYDARALQLWLLKCCQAVSWLAGARWRAVGTCTVLRWWSGQHVVRAGDRLGDGRTGLHSPRHPPSLPYSRRGAGCATSPANQPTTITPATASGEQAETASWRQSASSWLAHMLQDARQQAARAARK